MGDFEPKQFGKYFLLEKLAVGGMAEIYKAKTFGIDGFEKQLAIKRILPHCSADKDFITMLIDEAKLSVLLSHANIVQVYDLGKVGDDYFISMEFINGVNLRDLMYKCRERKVAIPPDIAVYIVSEMCKGLDYAHRKTDHNNQPVGIVHRDISPQNILISYEGEVKIVDFGIAKAAMNISHTMAGILKGKIAYMSPEQAMGKSIDHRTDIFSAGILAYEIITGSKLFTGESQFEVLKKIRTTQITAATLPDSVPAALKTCIAKSLAYDPENRYSNAGDLQIDLTKFLYSTYVDFSVRKLSEFIRRLFFEEVSQPSQPLGKEQSVEHKTMSMSIAEGAKQLEIVHRDTDSAISSDLLQENQETSATAKNKISPSEMPTSSRKVHVPDLERKKSKTRWPYIFIIPAILAGLAYAASQYLPPEIFPWNGEGQTQQQITPKTDFATIDIKSNPVGAKIFINDKDTAKLTPAIIDTLDIGKSYSIRLELDGYASIEKTIDATLAQIYPADFELVKSIGVINVITDPPGAAIIINGRLEERVTPMTLDGLPLNSELLVVITKPEYKSIEQVLKLTSGTPIEISTKLVPLATPTGTLVVDSQPAGASIFIDGKDSNQKTPATIDSLEAKKYEVALSLEGYEPWKRELDVAAEKTATAQATLTKIEQQQVVPAKKGAIYVASKPSGAAIFINGGATGKKTPASIAGLNIGERYNIQLNIDGYKRAYVAKVLSKESDSVFAQLKKEEEAKTPEQLAAEKAEADRKKAELEQRKKEDDEKKALALAAKKEADQKRQQELEKQEKENQGKGIIKDDEPPTGNGTGRIKVSSDPSGAAVFVNSEFKCTTPCSAEAQAGSASVIVSKEGLMKYSTRVTVKAGQTSSLGTVQLGDLFGEVTISSTPAAAHVTFDGQTTPKTPVTIRKVRRDSSHSVTVSLPGYKTWSKSFKMGKENPSFTIMLQSE